MYDLVMIMTSSQTILTRGRIAGADFSRREKLNGKPQPGGSLLLLVLRIE